MDLFFVNDGQATLPRVEMEGEVSSTLPHDKLYWGQLVFLLDAILPLFTIFVNSKLENFFRNSFNRVLSL